MKLHLSEQAYQWPGGVGKMVIGIWHDGKEVCITNEGRRYVHSLMPQDLVQVAHSHTRELELVPYSEMRPYPSEPIESP